MAGLVSFQLQYKGQTYEEAAAGFRRLARDFQISVDRLAPALRHELEAYLAEVTTELARRHSTPYPQGTTDESLSRRSGRLVASLRQGAQVSGTRFRDIVGRIVIPDPYAIHEFGGVIAAERAAFLTIPLPAALDARGLPLKRSARDWRDTFVGRSRAGNLLIFQRRGREIVPLYLLKREVRVRPRLGLRAGLQRGMQAFLERLAVRMTDELLAASE